MPATSAVTFGPTADLGRQTRAASSRSPTHEVTIPDLACAATYRYRIESVATVVSDDLRASSPVGTFTTAPCGGDEPMVMALTPAPSSASVIPGVSVGGLTNPSDRWIKTVDSAIWWNGEAERWDAVLPKGNGEHWLVTGFTDPTSVYVMMLENRGGSRPDVVYNEATNDLFVHFTSRSTAGASTMTRLTYSGGAGGSYSVAPAGKVAVPGIFVDTLTDGANNHPSSIYQTPNGDLWVAVLYNGGFLVQRSTNLGATWLAAPAVVDNSITSAGGLVGMADYTDGGTTYLMAFVTENMSGRFMPYRIDQNATNLAGANWVNEQSSLPAWIGSERSDDHMSIRSYQNRVYVAFKTEGAERLERAVDGHPAARAGRHVDAVHVVLHRQRKPRDTSRVAIDETNNQIYLFYGMISSPEDGAYKRVPLSSLGSIGSASQVSVFTTGAFNRRCGHGPAERELDQQSGRDRQRVGSGTDLAGRAGGRESGPPPVFSNINVAVTPTPRSGELDHQRRSRRRLSPTA